MDACCCGPAGLRCSLWHCTIPRTVPLLQGPVASPPTSTCPLTQPFSSCFCAVQVRSMTMRELRRELNNRGLATGGAKVDLEARLVGGPGLGRYMGFGC